MIEVNAVTKHHKDQRAADNLSFDVKPGQVTGFLGPHGSGKSTTMRMIVGLDAPDSGSIRINGQRCRDLPLPLSRLFRLWRPRFADP